VRFAISGRGGRVDEWTNDDDMHGMNGTRRGEDMHAGVGMRSSAMPGSLLHLEVLGHSGISTIERPYDSQCFAFAMEFSYWVPSHILL